jgi:hypothetical protein
MLRVQRGRARPSRTAAVALGRKIIVGGSVVLRSVVASKGIGAATVSGVRNQAPASPDSAVAERHAPPGHQLREASSRSSINNLSSTTFNSSNPSPCSADIGTMVL